MPAVRFLLYNPPLIGTRMLHAEITGEESKPMPRRTVFLIFMFLFLFASMPPVQAQLPPAKKDLLSPAQNAQGKAGCSTTGASSCAQAAAKILPIVMGASPLEENLRRLTDEVGGRVAGTPEMAKAVEWGVGAFRAAGVDVHAEKYTLPVTWSEGDTRLELIGSAQFPVHVVSTGWSPAIPAGGIEAPIVDIGSGSEQEFARARNIKGALLLAH